MNLRLKKKTILVSTFLINLAAFVPADAMREQENGRESPGNSGVAPQSIPEEEEVGEGTRVLSPSESLADAVKKQDLQRVVNALRCGVRVTKEVFEAALATENQQIIDWVAVNNDRASIAESSDPKLLNAKLFWQMVQLSGYSDDGMVEAMKETLGKGAELTDAMRVTRDGNYNIFHYAVSTRNPTVVHLLLTKAKERSHDLRQRLMAVEDSFGDNPLHRAIKLANVTVGNEKDSMNAIVEDIANSFPTLLGETNGKGNNPFHLALMSGEARIFEILVRIAIKEGFSSDFLSAAPNAEGTTPLMLAEASKDRRKMELAFLWQDKLIKQSAGYQLMEDLGGVHPFESEWNKAANTANLFQLTRDRVDVSKTASFAKKHPDTLLRTDQRGRTPLHMIAQSRDSAVVRLFVPFVQLGQGEMSKSSPEKQYVDMKDMDDFTALHYAIEAGNLDGTFKLLELGAVVTTNDLHTAISQYRSPEALRLVRALVDKGLRVTAEDISFARNLMRGTSEDKEARFNLQTIIDFLKLRAPEGETEEEEGVEEQSEETVNEEESRAQENESRVGEEEGVEERSEESVNEEEENIQ